jgi:hypothetical protein
VTKTKNPFPVIKNPKFLQISTYPCQVQRIHSDDTLITHSKLSYIENPQGSHWQAKTFLLELTGSVQMNIHITYNKAGTCMDAMKPAF